MAMSIPQALRSADITRFAVRAAQVEKAKPAIAYWCNYWILQTVLSRGLHNSDDESKAFAVGLMEKLEQMKTKYEDDDAITDDVAGQAYVEQFGLDTFRRAENAMRANKATRQTADTFQAAYTFLDLLHIWPPVDLEIAAKIKFAKFHALRIAKALKAGEDPNLSNPNLETPEDSTSNMDDSGIHTIGRPGSLENTSWQPSVEEVPDEHDHSNLDRSLPSGALSLSRPSESERQDSGLSLSDNKAENYYHMANNDDVSPIETTSDGGGYFPRVPGEAARQSGLPETPAQESRPRAALDFSGSPSFSQPPVPPLDDPSFKASLSHWTAPEQSTSHQLPPNQPFQQPRSAYGQSSRASHSTSVVPQLDLIPNAVSKQSSQSYEDNYIVDEEAIAKAQKHARWAISALNYEDVKTAVKELRGALETLGIK